MKKGGPAFVYFEQAVASAINFLTNIIVANELSSEKFGVFSISWLFVLFFLAVHQAGVVSPMLSRGSVFEKQYGDMYYCFNDALSFMFSLFAVLISIFTVNLLSSEIELALYEQVAFVFWVFFSHGQEYYKRKLTYLKQERTMLSVSLFSGFVRLFLFFMLWVLDIFTVSNVYVIMAASCVVFYLFFNYKILVFINKIHLFFDFIKDVLGYGRWLIGSSILQWLSGNIYVIVLGLVHGAFYVGVFRVAQNIFGVFNVLLVAVENIYAQKYLKWYLDGDDKSFFKNVLIRLVFWLIFSVLISVILWHLSDYLYELLYEKIYLDYSYVLVILVFMYSILVFNLCLRLVVRAIDEPKAIFNSTLISTVISLLTVYPIIYIYDLNGVLFGMYITQFIVLVYLAYYICKKFRFI